MASLVIFAGCDVAHARETVDVCHREVMKLVHEKLTTDFLAAAKLQSRSSLMLGLDSPGFHAVNIATELAQTGRVRSIAERLSDIEAVTTSLIQEIAEELFSAALPRLRNRLGRK